MPHENADLVRRWFEEVWNQRRAEAIDELLAPETIVHGLGEGGADIQGTGLFKQFHRQFTEAFPDMHITVEEVVCRGDMAAARFSGSGTHRGDHLGVPATGKAVTFTGMSFMRWRDGQIVEGWNNVDIPGILMQVGLLAPTSHGD